MNEVPKSDESTILAGSQALGVDVGNPGDRAALKGVADVLSKQAGTAISAEDLLRFAGETEQQQAELLAQLDEAVVAMAERNPRLNKVMENLGLSPSNPEHVITVVTALNKTNAGKNI